MTSTTHERTRRRIIAKGQSAATALAAEELRKMDAYWRASNYLSVGQIYLIDNPLLSEPLKREHVKPRLLGHWGTSPGLNMLYVHLNRVIKRDDLNMNYIIGPGHGLSADEVETALNRESGLLGVSSLSADMRQVLAGAQAGSERAALALAVYAHRVRQAIGALAVTMGGVDALIFTAGVGEHASEIRESICKGLECLGLSLDAVANASCTPDADVASSASPGRILVIATREDVTMFREVRRVLDSSRESSK